MTTLAGSGTSGSTDGVWQASPSVARIFRFRIQTCVRCGARAPALQVWRGGACRWLGGAEATCCHLPRPRWRTCSSPPGVARGAGQVAWRGPKPPGATRAFTWSQAAFGIYSRCFLHCFAHGHRRRKPSAPGAFCTVLPMSTGGVSHLLQVLFALFCPCPQAA